MRPETGMNKKGKITAMRLINIPDLSPADDDFTRLDLGEKATWFGLSGLPQSYLERRISQIRLSRYRGALQAARAAEPLDIVVSHLPSMSVAVSCALKALRKRNRHLAFAFNYTNLPEGLRKGVAKRAVQSMDRLVVFSRYEVDLYSTYFDVPREKISNLIWTQDSPPVSDFKFKSNFKEYFCAIGGEGRDVGLIIECARSGFPNVEFVIITRPHLIPKASIPENVTLLTNIPLADTWSIAARSIAVLVPLDSDTRCCGHITLVSAKLLGIPIVTTESKATSEYIQDRPSILKSKAGDVAGFSLNLEKSLDENENLRRAATNAMPSESKLHSRSQWEKFIIEYISLS